jgi:hypothetical protein
MTVTLGAVLAGGLLLAGCSTDGDRTVDADVSTGAAAVSAGPVQAGPEGGTPVDPEAGEQVQGAAGQDAAGPASDGSTSTPPTDAAMDTDRDTDRDPDQDPEAVPPTAGPLPPAGSIDQQVEVAAMDVADPQPLRETADAGDGVQVRITDVQAVDASSGLPGEINGPAVALTVEFDNTGSAAVGLDAVIVDITDATGAPALPITDARSRPVSGLLQPGQRQAGVWIVTVPPEARTGMTVAVSWSAAEPVVRFVGDLL